MKAKINKKGIVIIEPENELEDYALGKWSDDIVKSGKDYSKISIKNYFLYASIPASFVPGVL